MNKQKLYTIIEQAILDVDGTHYQPQIEQAIEQAVNDILALSKDNE